MWRCICDVYGRQFDSGSNPQHQFQGIITPESRDDTVQAAPEIQPMKSIGRWVIERGVQESVHAV